MSKAYTNDGKRRSSQTHARRTHECPVCQEKLRGNGAWSSHKRMHVRVGTAPESWIRRYPADARRKLKRSELDVSSAGSARPKDQP